MVRRVLLRELRDALAEGIRPVRVRAIEQLERRRAHSGALRAALLDCRGLVGRARTRRNSEGGNRQGRNGDEVYEFPHREAPFIFTLKKTPSALDSCSVQGNHSIEGHPSCLIANPGSGYREAVQTLEDMAERATGRRREGGVG